MSIRPALIAVACIGLAGCNASAPGVSFASLRADDPPPRTCRNVTADSVLLSGHAMKAAGLAPRPPSVGEAGVVLVPWPAPVAEPGSAPDPLVAEAMARLRTEAETSGCAVAFLEGPFPAAEAFAVVPPSQPDPVAAPGRSAWNGPAAPQPQGRPEPAPAPAPQTAQVTPAAAGTSPKATRGAAAPATAAGRTAAQPATPAAKPRPAPAPQAAAAPDQSGINPDVAQPAVPAAAAKPAFRPVERPPARTAAAARPAPRLEAADGGARAPVRIIPVTQPPVPPAPAAE